MTPTTLREYLMLPVAGLVPYARNARTHSPGQVAQIVASIREFGWTNPVLVDDAGGIIAGHGRVLAAQQMGLAEVPCLRIADLTPAQRRAYVLADNQLALNAGWDDGLLAAELAALDEADYDLALLGFSSADIDRLLADADADDAPTGDLDAVPEPRPEAITRPGDLWLLGTHRLLCGDSTDPAAVERLGAVSGADCVLTDPPYCSGGFQESGRSAGSIGTTRDVQILNDRLSTRGYMAMLKSVLGATHAGIAYVFTDWRMWTHLFDVAESSGYAVRSMIVWDKGYPALGRGWRTQHELVLFASREQVPFDPHMAAGNVIQSKRTGNPLHPTQKPVDVLEVIIGVTHMARVYYDPFAGSGTTLIAAEKTGRACLAMEISPHYCDVIIRRWQDLTGRTATRADTGDVFPG